jgi:Xaa-Pro aminopeptidase
VQLKAAALLTGPYDWDATLLPLAEFEARVAAVCNVITARNASGLIVHGNSFEHGALAYFTNFVPKLGPAFALVSANGTLRLLVSGSPTMLSTAQRLTWIEDVRPIGDLKVSIESWLAEFITERPSQIALCGDSKMALRSYEALKAAIASRGKLIDTNTAFEALRIHKSPLELSLIRRSCQGLTAASTELRDAFHSGQSARSIFLAAERAAYRAGAQDARVLVSAHPGAPPQFINFSDDPVVDPVLTYIAVRFAGYWSEGFFSLSRLPSPALTAAQRALAAILEKSRPGASVSELAVIAGEKLQPYSLHPFIKNSLGNSIGLSIEEPSETETADRQAGNATLQSGGVYSLRCGATASATDGAVVSAMIRVQPSRTEILWPSA